jgi:hypothetical protein
MFGVVAQLPDFSRKHSVPVRDALRLMERDASTAAFGRSTPTGSELTTPCHAMENMHSWKRQFG